MKMNRHIHPASLVVLVASSSCMAQIRSRDRIETILNGMVPTSASGYETADRLKEFPREETVDVIVQHLRHDPRFEDTTLRNIGYALLDDLRAETTPEGLVQLLEGLREGGYGAQALGRLGPNPPAGIVDALGAWLESGPQDGRQALVIRSLAAYKELSLPYFDAVGAVFQRRDLEYPTRFTAGKALMAIGGAKKALEKFGNDDADGPTEKIVLNSLTYWGAETEGTYNTDESVRRSLKQRVLSGLKHADRDVRYAAMEATVMGPYMMEIAVKDADGRWVLNPEVAAALRDVAANDPDEELHKKAASALTDDYTRFGERIERRRKAREEP